MIDPSNITNYNLTDYELEEHLIFWVLAAGKNGTTAAKLLEKLLYKLGGLKGSPFEKIRRYSIIGNLAQLMQLCGIGCYNNKSRTLIELANAGLDLSACLAADLEKIYGIGPKTARCFLLHSREGVRLSGLDTHMLKHLREAGVEDVPKSTPSSKKKYMILEQEVLRLADEAGMSPSGFDLMIWNRYSIKNMVGHNEDLLGQSSSSTTF